MPFMPSPPDPTGSDVPNLPAETGIVVIGGGVVGVSAALLLAEWGVKVVLCEKGRIAAEQSSRNWGWIRKQGRNPAELPLMIEAQDLWRRVADQVDTDIGLTVGGVTYLAGSEADTARHADWLEKVGAFQLDSRMLSAAETDALLGQSERRFRSALHTPSDCYAEPRLAVPAIARRAADLGAVIAEGTAVRSVLREAGAVRGVVTEHGTIRCDGVILAGGVWSRPFLENIGLSLPQLAVKSSALRTGPAPEISASTFGSSGASIRRRADGGYTVARSGAARFDLVPAAFRHFASFVPILKDRWRIIRLRAGRSFFGPLGHHRWEPDETSPFETCRIFDPAPDSALLKDVMESARRIYPQLADAQPVETWGGMIDVTPDEVPVIDTVDAIPGLVIATGFSGHGFGLGPGGGLLAAQLATGRDPVVNRQAFRYSRFDRARKAAA